GGRAAAARRAKLHERRRSVALAMLFGRARQQQAAGVARKDVEHDDVGQEARPAEALAALLDQPFVSKLAQHVLQPDAVAALQVEGAGELPLAGSAGVFRDVAEDVLTRWAKIRCSNLGGCGAPGGSAAGPSRRDAPSQSSSPCPSRSSSSWRPACALPRPCPCGRHCCPPWRQPTPAPAPKSPTGGRCPWAGLR